MYIWGDNYIAVPGSILWHLRWLNHSKRFHLQVQCRLITPPQECSLIKLERSILDAYAQKLVYSLVKKAPFWGIMHDGIQKFAIKYNVHPEHPPWYVWTFVGTLLLWWKWKYVLIAMTSSCHWWLHFRDFSTLKVMHTMKSVRKTVFSDISKEDIPVFYIVTLSPVLILWDIF